MKHFKPEILLKYDTNQEAMEWKNTAQYQVRTFKRQ